MLSRVSSLCSSRLSGGSQLKCSQVCVEAAGKDKEVSECPEFQDLKSVRQSRGLTNDGDERKTITSLRDFFLISNVAFTGLLKIHVLVP